MIDDRYECHFELEAKRFRFFSEGPKGKIEKIVYYSQTRRENIYNLGFGDYNGSINDFDDQIITNNGDSRKVLATVARSLYTFTDRYPDASIIATGSTLARTRLYRMGITNNLGLIEKDFHVWGFMGKEFVKFEKNAAYEAFLVKRKKINKFDI
ncbi:hypothetical protein [Niastella sp. OAS944]|uniref:DUF6934 family protein n=1 Tax=Niastella sp. OAS944 TaxID=2664089 RepID=UPI003492F8EF|nr:hypothetical protein [Chitinophagaceae bacterium OAS944]